MNDFRTFDYVRFPNVRLCSIGKIWGLGGGGGEISIKLDYRMVD